MGLYFKKKNIMGLNQSYIFYFYSKININIRSQWFRKSQPKLKNKTKPLTDLTYYVIHKVSMLTWLFNFLCFLHLMAMAVLMTQHHFSLSKHDKSFKQISFSNLFLQFRVSTKKIRYTSLLRSYYISSNVVDDTCMRRKKFWFLFLFFFGYLIFF